MKDIEYISFLSAMKEYIINDNNVIFHGKNNEIKVLFDANMSNKKFKPNDRN